MSDQMNQGQPESKGRGCLFGCLVAFGLMLALVLCSGVGLYWFVSGQIEKYTSATPVEIPVVEFEPERMAELEKRLETLGDTVKSEDQDASEFVLTADEINAMIAKNEDFRGKVFVKIEDGQVSGDVSIPTDRIPGGKGRYFNGSATVDVSMHKERLIVTLTGAEVNGDPIPQEVVDGIAAENLAKDAYRDPDHAKVLNRFDDIRIEGNKIILTLKQGESAPSMDDVDDASADNDEGNTDKLDADETLEEPAGV